MHLINKGSIVSKNVTFRNAIQFICGLLKLFPWHLGLEGARDCIFLLMEYTFPSAMGMTKPLTHGIVICPLVGNLG